MSDVAGVEVEGKLPMARRFRGFLPVVIDVECGGFNPNTDALLEIAAVLVEIQADGTLLPLPELKERLEAAGLDLSRPVVTSCGSGVTAAIITLALTSLGHTDNALYDGSWSEWGGRQDTPVVTGNE